MIAHILLEAGLDPLVSVGASIFELHGKNAHAGSGSLAVVEADEYDRSFLALAPYIAVITTLEPEHLDIYSGLADLQDAFVQFASGGSDHGVVIVNIDEPALRSVLSRFTKKIVTFGVRSEEAKYRATEIETNGLHTTATILRSAERIGTLELSVPGVHNIKNALAAIAAAESLAIPFDICRDALQSFRGAERRAQVIGETDNILVIDDYAHHPTEIEATLSALRSGYPGRRIVAAFQPHTFTRTKDFAEEFGNVFAKYADVLYLAEIYPSREEPIRGVTSKLIYDSARNAGLKNIEYVHSLDELAAWVAGDITAGDIVITLGAGSITEQAPKILKIIASSSRNHIRPKRNIAVSSR
jgi:UDP-N-acetylmuramate--alanine ligase